MKNKKSGFTLIEMVVTLAVVSFVTAGLYTAYKANMGAYTVTEDTIHVQQAIRAAMHKLIHEVRMAGYDPLDTGNFGIYKAYEVSSGSRIEFSYDFLEDGNASAPTNKRIFEIADLGDDGVPDLSLEQDSSGRNSIGEGIEALGLAYGFDQDGDGELDRTASNHEIWAVDLNNDGYLDTNLDTNDDGKIDAQDDSNNDGIIEGASLSNVVPLEKARAVRIWIIGRSLKKYSNSPASHVYVSGRKVVSSANDGYSRSFLEYTVKLRNMGL